MRCGITSLASYSVDLKVDLTLNQEHTVILFVIRVAVNALVDPRATIAKSSGQLHARCLVVGVNLVGELSSRTIRNLRGKLIFKVMKGSVLGERSVRVANLIHLLLVLVQGRICLAITTSGATSILGPCRPVSVHLPPFDADKKPALNNLEHSNTRPTLRIALHPYCMILIARLRTMSIVL